MSQFVLVIVEGRTDETALYIGLEDHFRPIGLQIEVLSLDVFTGDRANYNVVHSIADEIRSFLLKRKLKKQDILFIAQITDLDGCYINEESIVVDPNHDDLANKEWIYGKVNVITKSLEKKDDLVTRNKAKSRNTDIVSRKNVIFGIPYGLYFMSANLEHVITKKPNNDENSKIDKSEKFEEKVLENKDFFTNFFNSEEICPFNDYEGSWTVVKEGSNSLNGTSNLFFLLEKIKELK